MKSVSVAAAAAVLAGVAIAQPHGHHHAHHHAKRDFVTEYSTVWETVTVLVDDHSTQTILPTGQAVPSSSAVPTSVAPISSVRASSVKPSSRPFSAPSVPTTTSIITSTSTSISSTSSVVVPTTTSTSSVATTSSSSAAALTSAIAPIVSVAPPAAPTGRDDGGYVYTGPDPFGSDPMDSEQYHGQITYYNLGIGACGYDDTGKDLTTNLVAISQADFRERNPGTSLGLNEPNHPWCDQVISITANGQTTLAVVHDDCPGCAHGSIDVSEAVFNTLFGSLTVGRADVTWSFVN